MNSPERPKKHVIGWREFAALPEWKIQRVKAKIDTGARTSALHVQNIVRLPGNRVRFEVVVREGETPKTKVVETDLERHTNVRPSHGETQERLVVHTKLRLGDVERMVDISLVDRAGMLCRMLVGRRSLGDTFVVDPVRRYVLTGKRAREPK